MDARSFLGLEQTDDPLRWRLRVTPSVSTPGHFLYGGCALAAGIVALEEVSGRPTVWATAQYLSYAPTGTEVEWEVVLAATGRNTTQGRAIARVGDDEIITVNAALGRGSLEVEGTWVEPPMVPPPDECPVQVIPTFFADTVLTRVEHRVAKGRLFSELDGTPGEANSAFWARLPGHLDVSAATLAVIGDYVSGAVSQPLGRRTLGRSLDNTVRVARLVPTEWVLCDIHIQALAHGFAQGEALLWSEDGTLLGTASQSISVRLWTEDTVFVRPGQSQPAQREAEAPARATTGAGGPGHREDGR